jgi:hypothetical protein
MEILVTFSHVSLLRFPISLWGCDALKDTGLFLASPNTQVTQMILNQGFDPRAELGVTHQGITQPIKPLQKKSTWFGV